MVSFLYTVLAVATAFNTGTNAFSLRAASSTVSPRKLDEDGYGFLVSQIREDVKWCLTAVTGATDFAELGFRPCDFEGTPSNQFFQFDTDGKLRTQLDASKCMIADHGENLFDGVHMRLADCDLETDLNKFTLNADSDGFSLSAVDTTDYLTLNLDPSFCITNRGPNPNPGDTILAKPCQQRGDYKWTFQLPPTPPTSSPTTEPTVEPTTASPTTAPTIEICKLRLAERSACIEPENGKTADFTKLKLGSCDPSRGWQVERGDEVTIIRSLLDETKCMQAGNDTVSDGTKMRLFTCDPMSDTQKFTWNEQVGGPIQVLAEPDYCVTYRGTNAFVGVDPIIMIDCNKPNRDIDWTCDLITPSATPSASPSQKVTPAPSSSPTGGPTKLPTSPITSPNPTEAPMDSPAPSPTPSSAPIAAAPPTDDPDIAAPTLLPSSAPSSNPSVSCAPSPTPPSSAPTDIPTETPTLSAVPTPVCIPMGMECPSAPTPADVCCQPSQSCVANNGSPTGFKCTGTPT